MFALFLRTSKLWGFMRAIRYLHLIYYLIWSVITFWRHVASIQLLFNVDNRVQQLSFSFNILEMARVHRVAFISTLVTIAYLLTFFGIFSVPLVDHKVVDQILPVVSTILFQLFESDQRNFVIWIIWMSINQLPWWLLVSFGAYSLSSIGWGLLTLRECPEAFNELMSVSTLCSIRFYLYKDHHILEYINAHRAMRSWSSPVHSSTKDNVPPAGISQFAFLSHRSFHLSSMKPGLVSIYLQCTCDLLFISRKSRKQRTIYDQKG